MTITAKTDKTGDQACGTEDLTVIWTAMSFRGSDHQGEAIDAGNARAFTDFLPHDTDEIGLQEYNLTGAGADVFNNMEIKVTISPNVVIPDVAWDIKREIRFRDWFPLGGRQTVNSWASDDAHDNDEDLTQAVGDLNIFVIDAPTGRSSSTQRTLAHANTIENARFYSLNNFREWVEIEIGSKWYITSDYYYWKCKIHARNGASPPNWSRVAPNEIVPGSIAGDPNNWTQPAPVFTSVSPNHGSGTVEVTVSGINFEPGTTTKLKRGATEISGTSVTINNSAELTCSFDVTGQESGTKWDLMITTPYGDTVTESEVFTVD